MRSKCVSTDENPLNGDLHIVVREHFVAFKGPKDLPGGREHRDSRGTRDFSPKYYVEIFQVGWHVLAGYGLTCFCVVVCVRARVCTLCVLQELETPNPKP